MNFDGPYLEREIELVLEEFLVRCHLESQDSRISRGGVFFRLRSELSGRPITEIPLSVTRVVIFSVKSRRDIELSVSELEVDAVG